MQTSGGSYTGVPETYTIVITGENGERQEWDVVRSRVSRPVMIDHEHERICIGKKFDATLQRQSLIMAVVRLSFPEMDADDVLRLSGNISGAMESEMFQ